MESISWRCPFCNHDTIITNQNYRSGYVGLDVDNKHGTRMAYITYIVCPNQECKEFTMEVHLYRASYISISKNFIPVDNNSCLKVWKLIPASEARVFPDYIPLPIRKDYEEACLIRDLSPKASATLSRRCLQGIIRDFWGISKGRLVDEIEAIKGKVDPLTWDAIDTVRSVGNIGAHMEKDINIVIDVEPEEAGLLIGLIENLISDWYIAKYEREQRFKNIVQLKVAKQQAQNGTPAV